MAALSRSDIIKNILVEKFRGMIDLVFRKETPLMAVKENDGLVKGMILVLYGGQFISVMTDEHQLIESMYTDFFTVLKTIKSITEDDCIVNGSDSCNISKDEMISRILNGTIEITNYEENPEDKKYSIEDCGDLKTILKQAEVFFKGRRVSIYPVFCTSSGFTVICEEDKLFYSLEPGKVHSKSKSKTVKTGKRGRKLLFENFFVSYEGEQTSC